MTGTTSRIIHSGRLPDSRKLSTTFKRLLLAGEIEVHQHRLDGLGANPGREGVLAIFVLRGEQLVFRQELVLLERGEARLDHDIALEIEDALELLQLHVEQQANAARE